MIVVVVVCVFFLLCALCDSVRQIACRDCIVMPIQENGTRKKKTCEIEYGFEFDSMYIEINTFCMWFFCLIIAVDKCNIMYILM